jgi:hypothetical protein
MFAGVGFGTMCAIDYEPTITFGMKSPYPYKAKGIIASLTE